MQNSIAAEYGKFADFSVLSTKKKDRYNFDNLWYKNEKAQFPKTIFDRRKKRNSNFIDFTTFGIPI